ncbi:glycosyltransferase [bacterium]|nr:glycosyltransferase [bacterium]
MLFRPISLSSTPPSKKKIKSYPSAAGNLTRRTFRFFSKPSVLFSIKILRGPLSSSALASRLNPPIPKSPFSHPFPPPISPAICRSLARYMQESKIFLSSSRYESFGLASVEASACGCAVVGSSKILTLVSDLSCSEPLSFDSTSTLLSGKLQHAANAHLPSSKPMTLLSESSPPTIARILIGLFA